MRGGQRDIFRGVREEKSGEWSWRDSLVERGDRRLERKDRFRCGIGELSLEGDLNNADIVIVVLDRFEGGPIISKILRRGYAFRFSR